MEHVLPEEFDSKIFSTKTLVLIYASWCPYCVSFKLTFEEINSDGIQKKAVLVDEDENPLWDRFDIQAVPTMIAFQNGNILARRDTKKGIGLTGKNMESMFKELN